MARRVFLHLGLPKTATTYLQTILWASRDRLRADGVLLPGEERRDHLWASRVVREDPNLERQPERHRTAWARLRAELAAWDGDGLVSHEFFAAASAAQAAAMIEELAPAEVHLVATAREPLGLFTASWQESLKNRNTVPAAGVRPVGLEEPARHLELAHPRPAAGAAPLGRDPAARARPRAAAAPRRPPGGDLGDVRRRGRRRPGGVRHRPVVPERVDGRGRGRDPATGQRAPRLVRAGLRPRRLHPHLPRRRAPGAARRGALLAGARPGRGLPAPGPPGRAVRARSAASTYAATWPTSWCPTSSTYAAR